MISKPMCAMNWLDSNVSIIQSLRVALKSKLLLPKRLLDKRLNSVLEQYKTQQRREVTSCPSIKSFKWKSTKMKRHSAFQLLITTHGNQIWNSSLNCTSQLNPRSHQDWAVMTPLPESPSWMRTNQVLFALKRPNWMSQQVLKKLTSKFAELMELMARWAALSRLKLASLQLV